jgi:hypothetical protein
MATVSGVEHTRGGGRDRLLEAKTCGVGVELEETRAGEKHLAGPCRGRAHGEAMET